MQKILEGLQDSLRCVELSREFEMWVRVRLRRYVPHAAFLATLGKLYGNGTVPTHKIGVDYPLSLVEGVKNSTGELDDPLMCGWLRNGKLKQTDVPATKDKVSGHIWERTLTEHGIESVLVHGYLDHRARRFAIFQVANIEVGGAFDISRLFAGIVEPMARAAWRTVDAKCVKSPRRLVGHPTVSLTVTEIQIIELLAQGFSNKEIARMRGVSDSTIKTQVSRTGAKLGASRRSEIAATGMKILSPLPAQGLVSYDD